jgi:excisionase family DNA binding protein
MAPMTRKYLTTNQVAEMYATDEKAVRRWIRSGRLKAVNVGTSGCPRYRVSEAELVRYDEANVA